MIFFVAAALLLGVRPHRIHASTGFAAAVYVVLGVLSLMMAAANRNPSVTLENAKLIVCVVLVVLMVARVVLDGVTTFFEWKYWRGFREQNKEAMQDGGVAGSASERITFDYDVDSYDLGALESGRKVRGEVVKIPGGEAPFQMEDLMVGDGGSHVTLAARTESVNSNQTETFEDDDEGSLASSSGSAGDSSASISTPPAPKDASMVSGSSTKSSKFSSSSELL